MIDAIEKQAQRAVANDKDTSAWQLVLMLVRKLRAANAEHAKLNEDYDVLVKHYAEMEAHADDLVENYEKEIQSLQLCECGLAPEIKNPFTPSQR